MPLGFAGVGTDPYAGLAKTTAEEEKKKRQQQQTTGVGISGMGPVGTGITGQAAPGTSYVPPPEPEPPTYMPPTTQPGQYTPQQDELIPIPPPPPPPPPAPPPVGPAPGGGLGLAPTGPQIYDPNAGAQPAGLPGATTGPTTGLFGGLGLAPGGPPPQFMPGTEVFPTGGEPPPGMGGGIGGGDIGGIGGGLQPKEPPLGGVIGPSTPFEPPPPTEPTETDEERAAREAAEAVTREEERRTGDISGRVEETWESIYGEEGSFDPTRKLMEEQRDEALRQAKEAAAARGMLGTGAAEAMQTDIMRGFARDIAQKEQDWRQTQIQNKLSAASMMFQDSWHNLDQRHQEAMAELMLEIERRRKYGEDYSPEMGDYEMQLLMELAKSDNLDTEGQELLRTMLAELFPDLYGGGGRGGGEIPPGDTDVTNGGGAGGEEYGGPSGEGWGPPGEGTQQFDDGVYYKRDTQGNIWEWDASGNFWFASRRAG